MKYDGRLAGAPPDGRLLLILSNDPSEEPRMQVNDSAKTQQLFGIDVEHWSPAKPQVIDAGVLGYPRDSLRDVPAGKYRVQAVLHRYETFQRNGHTIKLPMDRGEGQQWNRAPGNLYSKPIEITFDPKSNATIQLALDQVIPEIVPPKDTKYVRHERIQSKLLTKFWGRPMYLGAHVLVPEGFDDASEGALSAHHQSRPLPGRLRRLSRDAARSESEAGLQRALSVEGLQPDAAGRGVSLLQALDRPEIPARARSSRSSTRIRTTTIRTRSTRRTSARMALRSRPS